MCYDGYVIARPKHMIRNKKVENKSLEVIVRKRNKRKNLQNTILAVVATAGIIGISAIAPNVLWAMKKMGLLTHKRQRESIEASRKNLIKRGYLKINNEDIKITPKGKAYLAKHSFYKKSKEIKKWDGKWRVLIFDIPEKLRFVRDEIRATLISIGFMRLQDSVWIYPYDCEDLITLLKADLEIGKDALYMIVDELEEDKIVKEYFNLN